MFFFFLVVLVSRIHNNGYHFDNGVVYTWKMRRKNFSIFNTSWLWNVPQAKTSKKCHYSPFTNQGRISTISLCIYQPVHVHNKWLYRFAAHHQIHTIYKKISMHFKHNSYKHTTTIFVLRVRGCMKWKLHLHTLKKGQKDQR